MIENDYVVLSRKYRPKKLSDLIGQDVLVRSLRTVLDNKKVPHAFLFCGMRGVGKTTTARILSRCLNCIGTDESCNMTSEPCGLCRSCVALDCDQHMDIMEFDAASRTGVDDIREVIDSCQYMPVLGRYRIFIIDEVHMLSKSAFNALLKTLEEPPAHVKFIFATTESNKIPETIHSRCMTFQLKPVGLEAVARHVGNICSIEGFVIEDEAAQIVATESEGSVRDAISILEQAMMLSFEESSDKLKKITKETILKMLGGVSDSEIQELLMLILAAKTKETIIFLERLTKNGADPTVIYKNLQTALYRLITAKVLGNALPSSLQTSLANLLYIWQILLKQAENFKTTAYQKEVLVATAVILAETAVFPDIEKLMINCDQDVERGVGSINLSSKQADLTSKVEDIIGQKIEIKEDASKKIVENVMEKFQDNILTKTELE